MNRVDVTKLLKRIKAHWNYFNDAEYVVDEWLRLLKPYDSYDVNAKLDNYIEDNEKDKPPTAKYMSSYLLTPEQKESSKKGILVDCNLCHKTMLLSEYDSHYGRCLTIASLLRIYRDKGETISYEELNTFTTERLNKFYENEKGSVENERNKITIRGIQQIN